MNISHTLDIDAERQRQEWLDIAHRLYQALIAQDPNRVITLCDGDGRVVARHYARPERRIEIAKVLALIFVHALKERRTATSTIASLALCQFGNRFAKPSVVTGLLRESNFNATTKREKSVGLSAVNAEALCGRDAYGLGAWGHAPTTTQNSLPGVFCSAVTSFSFLLCDNFPWRRTA